MILNIKKLYYSLSSQDFNKKLAELQNNPSAVHICIGTHKFFFIPDDSIIDLLMDMHRTQADFDHLISTFLPFSQRKIAQSFFIDEIQGTNRIENIQSTKHDIFYAMQNIQTIDDKHIQSIVHSYQKLLQQLRQPISDLASLRTLYDQLMSDAYDSQEDKPDGQYFRKNAVFITNDTKNVHHGLMPESAINDAMLQFLKIYNNVSLDIYIRLILSHFLLETVHPFYDGNGRFGRFLFSKELYDQEKTLSAFLVASSINSSRGKYYKAFSTVEDVHEYGCLNQYTETMLSIILSGLKKQYEKLLQQRQEIAENMEHIPAEWSKSEKIIYRFLNEAGSFTYFGIASKEMQQETRLSR